MLFKIESTGRIIIGRDSFGVYIHNGKLWGKCLEDKCPIYLTEKVEVGTSLTKETPGNANRRPMEENVT
jgi:hypothetical protein